MPKKLDIQKEILKFIMEKIDIHSLSQLVQFNGNVDETIKLENINVNTLDINNFYNALKNSNREEQLSFFKKNINQHSEIFEKLFKICSLEKESLFYVLYYDTIVYLIENGINLLDIVPRESIAKSDGITLQEKIALLENYYLKVDYQTVDDIINLILDYYNQEEKDKMNEIFIQLESSDFKINKNYYFAQDTYSEYELEEMFKHIKSLNQKRISLNDILYKIFRQEYTNDGIKLLNKYNEEIIKRLLNHETFNENLFNYKNFELIKLFMKKYTNIIFTENNLEYVMKFYIPFFNRVLQRGEDILKYYPLFSLKNLDSLEIKKIIMENFNYDLPICKYFFKIKADFKDITLCLNNNYYNVYYNYFFKLEESLRGRNISIEEIKNIKTIYSNNYIKLLSYLNTHDNKELYDFGYKIFIKDIKKFVKVKDNEEEYEGLMKLYYKNCINGFPLSKLLYFNDEIELNIHQKFKKEFDVADICDIKKIKVINAKEYLKIIKKYESKYKIENKDDFEYFILKGLLVFPYDKLKIILDNIDDNFIVIIKKLFKDIDVNKVIIDGNKIIYNKKMINLIFKNNQKFKSLDNNNDLVIYFTYIYNYWDDIIKFYKTKNISLKMAINFVKEKFFVDEKLLPQYNDLKDYLYYIICDEKINNDKEVFEILDKYYLDMKMRYYATIPQVKGEFNGYHYEMLNTNDPFVLAVGKLTNCCFRIDGHAKTALHYTMLNPNNRIFCVWKDNELVAQSWVWRKGNYLCFDNIECIKKEAVNANIWGECYLEAAKKIYSDSLKKENELEHIKMITLGKNPRDVVIEQLKSYENIKDKEEMLIPTSEIPNEIKKIYTDSIYEQIVLYKEPCFTVKKNSKECHNIYLDKRSKIQNISKISNDILLLKRIKDKIISINALIGKETPLDSIKEGEVGDGWYHYQTSDNKEYSGIFSYDPRAYQEYELSLKKKFK